MSRGSSEILSRMLALPSIHRYAMGMATAPSSRPSFPSGSLDLVLLSLIARQATHGYRLARLVEEVSDGRLAVEEGSLYPSLQRLKKRKLVEAEWQKQENGREVRIYSITPAGKVALREGVQEWTSVTGAIAKFLNTKLADKIEGSNRVRFA